MHYSLIRDRIWAAADYAPANSPEGIARTREHINRALMRILLDAPFLFERELDLYLDPDILPDNTVVADTWTSSTNRFDAWTLRTSWDSSSYPLKAARLLDPERPLSGRWLEFKDPSDPTGQKVITLRIREVWEEDVDGGFFVIMSFFDPMPYETGFTAATTGVIEDWRVTMKQYALPPEVVEIQTVRPYDALDDRLTFSYVSASEASSRGLDTSYWDSEGTTRPWVYWPGTVENVVNMNAVPAFTGVAGLWSTAVYAEPKGEFEYVYTLSLGERHDEVQDGTPLGSPSTAAAGQGRRMPYLESPPSPLVGPLFSALPIGISTPDFSSISGFGDNATLRYRRVGLKANFYRRRVSVDPTYAFSWPTSNHYQHVGTVSFLASGSASFTDDGESVPGRRLRHVGGYKTLRFSAAPDKTYRLCVRAVVRPHEMLDDSDACEVPPSAIDALIFLGLRNLYEASGNPSMAASSFADYERALHALKKRHASLRPTADLTRLRARTTRRRRLRRGHIHAIDTP